MITRAAIYARVSSQAQRERHTIENQLRVLPAFVTSQGWTLVDTFIDDGRSAKSGKLDAREGFAALLRAAELGAFDVLVVVDVDRLTRTDSLEERARILGPFQRLGIDIVTPSGGRLDMRTMLGELWVTIQALGAAEENRKRAERIKAGKARAIAEGRKPAGPTPYGLAYSRARGTWSIDEVAAVIVREIYRRVGAGESCVRIADDLAMRGAPGPRTGWSRAAVYRIVRKRSACGEWTADKAKGTTIRVPAIVTEQEWHDAQRALLRHRRRGLIRTKHVYLLEGLARCAACGGRIGIRSATTNPNGYRNPAAYVCQVRKLERGCSAPIVRCAEIDARVWERLTDELAQPDIIEALAGVVAERANDARDWQADADGYRAHLARLDAVERKVTERFRRDLLSEAGFDAELAALGRERKMLREQISTAERALGSSLTAKDRLQAASSTVEALRDAMPLATPEQRRALLRELVHDGGVLLARGRVKLDLRLMRARSIVHAESAGYSAQHGAISMASLRLRALA